MWALSLIAGCSETDTLPTTDYGLFIADGSFDPLDASYTPPAFEDFFYDRLGMSAADLEQVRADAKSFYLESYGLDVDAELAAGRISWNELRFDPRGQYRAYALPGRAVPREGWVVDDVTLAPLIIDPAGIELSGPYEGVVAEPGMFAVTGIYAVEALDESGEPDETMLIYYHSDGLAANSFEGRALLYCVMESDDLGTGLGHVTSAITQLEDGRLHYEFTNAQTW